LQLQILITTKKLMQSEMLTTI